MSLYLSMSVCVGHCSVISPYIRPVSGLWWRSTWNFHAAMWWIVIESAMEVWSCQCDCRSHWMDRH